MPMTPVEYEVSAASPRRHRFRVICTVPAPDAEGQRFTLPSWVPGSYLIREFARNILSVSASDDAGNPVAVHKRDKQTWQAAPVAGALTLTYELHARDSSVRAAYLDDRRGFFDGTSVYLRPVGGEAAPCRVRLPPLPESDWRVATSLPAVAVDAAGFGEYAADDYRSLIDHPVAMGQDIDRIEFEAGGAPHAFVCLGRHDADREKLAADLTRVCEAQAAVFGEMPMDDYLFLAQIAGAGYGGLEHRASAALLVERNALPVAGATGRSEAYVELLGLCSHEYFHLWNVKRIQPAAVADSNLSAEVHFEDLWAYEGVTSYYDDLALVRAGLINETAYLGRLQRIANRLAGNPGRRCQSLAQSSFDAWTKFYRPDENSPNAVVSYYGKGALVALCLDLLLRDRTEGRVNLDTVMARLWAEHGRPGIPVPENGLEAMAASVAGVDLSDFFDGAVRGTDELPLAELLARFGVRARRVTPDARDGTAFLLAQGMRLGASAGPARLLHVLMDSPAETAGLCPGDVIMAVDGLRAEADTLTRRLRRVPTGTPVTLHLFRDDELLIRRLAPRAPAADQWRFRLMSRCDAETAARRMAWLSLPS